ncbi:MAG TPA: lysophospholipid acyltransferase family protein [Jatrophihabitans sp.]|jgi:1-acyl-sn-glycerol-3-phosphate acyltransferase|nr:lysophospholipid acyltransferase family protein [Jatrophihabitans sp.]
MRFAVVLVYPLVTLLFRRRWAGLDRIPATGPAIVAVNHISYADPLIFARFIWDAGRVPRYLAKASLFTLPFPLGRIVTGAGQIPVHRDTLDAAQALQGAVEALGRGEVVLIYPEGTVTRDPDFWPMQAKTGVARLALLAPGVPVIPVGQWGAQYFLDVYARRFRPWPRKRITISAGPPVDLSDFAGTAPDSRALRQMTDRIMVAIRDLVAEIRDEEPPAEFYRRPVARRDGSR